VPKGAFASITVDRKKTGPILDISRGGLAFKYIGNDEPFEGTSELEMFHRDKYFRLKGMPFTIASDVELKNTNPFSSITMRRIGIQFGAISQNQREELDSYINSLIQ